MSHRKTGGFVLEIWERATALFYCAKTQEGNHMSKSSLISYECISPNRTSPRNHKIDTISIHCYVGQVSVEGMADWLCNPSAQASANYAIGTDGRIALIVPEGDRSWCTSSKANDHRAITIECASDSAHPYAVNNKVYQSLLDLLTDICQRNDIQELRWRGDKNLIGQVDRQNMTVHRWFANKACPGDYLYNRHGEIAAEVNRRLGVPDINIKGVKIDDSNVEAISKVVYGEAGVIRSYNALLGVAQCIHDMWQSGQYGKTVTEVLQRNFAAYGSKETTDEARQAVYDVFCQGVRRFPDAQVLQFRSFTKYSDGAGNLDKQKCADLLAKYEYLGKDARNNQWGHLYFGQKVAAPEPINKQIKVQAGSFDVKENADAFAAQIKAAGFQAIVKQEDGQYKVQCGAFDIQENAENLVQQLKAAGFPAIIK